MPHSEFWTLEGSPNSSSENIFFHKINPQGKERANSEPAIILCPDEYQGQRICVKTTLSRLLEFPLSGQWTLQVGTSPAWTVAKRLPFVGCGQSVSMSARRALLVYKRTSWGGEGLGCPTGWLPHTLQHSCGELEPQQSKPTLGLPDHWATSQGRRKGPI